MVGEAGVTADLPTSLQMCIFLVTGPHPGALPTSIASLEQKILLSPGKFQGI